MQKTTGTSVWCCSYTEAPDGTVSWEVEAYISLSPPYPFSGIVCNHIHFRVTYRGLPVLRNIGVQTVNIHIKDFFPLLDSVCFRGLGSTPVQGISNIYWKMLYIGVRANLMLEATIVTQEFFILAHPDRNNCITSVSYFVQPRKLSSVSSVLPMGICRLGIHLHPCQKHPGYSKTSLVSAQYLRLSH